MNKCGYSFCEGVQGSTSTDSSHPNSGTLLKECLTSVKPLHLHNSDSAGFHGRRGWINQVHRARWRELPLLSFSLQSQKQNHIAKAFNVFSMRCSFHTCSRKAGSKASYKQHPLRPCIHHSRFPWIPRRIISITSQSSPYSSSSPRSVQSSLKEKKPRSIAKKEYSQRSRKQGYLCTSHIPDHYIH